MTLLLLRYRLRIFLRLLRDRFFTLFVLAPLILGGVFYTLQPAAAMLAERVQWSSRSFVEQFLLTALGLAAWTAAFWPSAVRETAPAGGAAACLDALPVPAAARFHVAFAAQFLRNAGFAALLLALWAPASLRGPAPYVFAAAAAGLQLALVSIYLSKGKAAAAVLGLGLTAAAAAAWTAFPGILAAAAAWAAARWLSGGHRQTAPRSAPRRRRGGLSMLRLPDEIRPQLLRDLLLTRRFFSPAVFFAAAGALAALSSAWTLRDSAGARWSAPIVLAGCALAALALSSLAPLLLRLQIPRFWLERSSPVQADSIWKTKVWYASLISIPPALAAAPALASLPGENFAVLAAQALLVVLAVSSAVALLMFEAADRPALGLTQAGLLGCGFAGSYVLFWEYLPWVGLLHAYALHVLANRARQTAARVGGPPL